MSDRAQATPVFTVVWFEHIGSNNIIVRLLQPDIFETVRLYSLNSLEELGDDRGEAPYRKTHVPRVTEDHVWLTLKLTEAKSRISISNPKRPCGISVTNQPRPPSYCCPVQRISPRRLLIGKL